MREIDDDYPTLDVFDAIHRELVTIIGHCTFHRSLLQDLLLRSAAAQDASGHTLERWREDSIASIEQLRFSDLNKGDKELASAVYDEASRIGESFWNVLLSRAQTRERVEPGKGSVAAAPSDADQRAALDGTTG
ncbi:MAG: hypothetical protein PVF63_03615 [Gammaproteobacteria bacterium]|jgi:hypothetical protein